MPLGFDCPRCGHRVLVHALRPGDEAVCRRRGERLIVPESAAQTDDLPDYRVEDPRVKQYGWSGQLPSEVEELASRISRLLASLVDGLIMMAFAIPLFVILLARYPGSITELTETFKIVWIGIPCLIYSIGINSYFWATRGQSIGKIALGIKIVEIDDRRASWGRIVGLRVLPMQLIGWIPLIGGLLGLVDILMIFRSNRRCLHDEIARTKVIRCVSRPAP